MTKTRWLSAVLILGVLLSLFGLKYRLRQYDSFPFPQQNFDEYGYLWLGKSLLSTGVPANWSALPFYNQYRGKSRSIAGYNISENGKTPNIKNWSQFNNPLVTNIEATFDNNYKSQFLLVQPYLDNPPLAGIFFALVDPGRSIVNNTVSYIRLLPVVALSTTVLTLFVLGYRLFSFKTGLITAGIYALGPGFVISSRMAVPENLIAALFPLTILIFYCYQKKPRTWLLVLNCILCLMAIWLKISGIIIPMTLTLLAFRGNRLKSGWVIVATTITGLLSYVVYGLLYNANLFWQMLSTQGSRAFSGPVGILVKILHPEIPAPFYDGWIIIGYLSVIGITFLGRKQKQYEYVSYPVVCFLIFFTLFGGLNYPWYQFIVYPILALAAGVVINNFIDKPRIEFNLLFFLIVVSTLLHYSQYTDKWIDHLNVYRLQFGVLVLAGLGSLLLCNKQVSLLILKNSLIAMFLYSLYLGIGIINNLNVLWPLLMENNFKIF
jgi:4-amino-4-deoxy-L-arabinose transferase-like glycosyltransferase